MLVTTNPNYKQRSLGVRDYIRATRSALLLGALSLAATPAGLADGNAVGPFTARGTLTLHTYRPRQTNEDGRTDALFTFAYTNGWWEADVRHLRACFKNGFMRPDV